ncbi:MULTISPECIES: helix-turn-helix domain-containing protein [Exiguobacterium]|uniref:helix-turn-helix domain-containing protein n=1 Tax=Exiguobacterium TaxID=33986 RepID=UPI001AE970C9|nr:MULTISPECIES: helix-turn-helix domain-containing protein [Exiguobacterium]MCT4781455.1 helix-turn-helix transcriptional regulator [Exiguobacterium soli]
MNSLPVSIGNEIKQIRKEKRMTQAALCQGICSQAEISKIENGRNSPTIDLLQQIAKRLRVPMSMLFRDQHRSEQFRECDRLLTRLLRNHQFDELLIQIEKIKSRSANKEIVLLLEYFEIISKERTKKVDFRSSISQLVHLTDTEDVWFESPQMYLRIKMAIANFYFENKQFIHSENVYEEILGLNYDTIELKKTRIKIIYNHAQQLSFQKNYTKGLEVVAVGIKESLALDDASFLGHFYYQRGYFTKKTNGNLQDIKRDFTLSYSLFKAFEMPSYEQLVVDSHEEFLLYKF